MLNYHKDVFLPKRIKGMVPQGRFKVAYSGHAQIASQTDRYGAFDLPARVDVNVDNIFEVSVAHGQVVKYGVRIPLDNERDLCMIVTRDRVVKTVWVNLKTDHHTTLRQHCYVTKAQQKFISSFNL